MNNTIKTLSSIAVLALTSGLAHSATLLTVAGNGGMIDGTSTTYTIGAGTTADQGGNGISFTEAAPITISFTGLVDLVISPTTIDASFVFDTAPGNFTSVGGVLNYTVGTDNAEDVDLAYAIFAGNGTNTFSWTVGGNDDSGHKTRSNDDWGTITANGITSISFTNTSFKDTYSFSATAVPEPSSTALLGLGGLALMLRRRR